MTNKTDEQEREAFEAEYAHAYPVAASRPGKFDREDWGDYVDASVGIGWRMYQAGRAALQSQPAIRDDLHLSLILDMYDNAMQKAFDGREFSNPCVAGTREAKAWDKGKKEGQKKRSAGLPNSISLQSQDREDARRLDWLDKTAYCADWMEDAPTKRVIRAHDGAEFTGDTWREAIDHARRIEENE